MGVKGSFKKKGGRPSSKPSISVRAVEEDRCSICQESIGVPAADGTVEGWSRLPCGHRFGSLCVKRWFGLSPTPTCPICRRSAAHRCGHPVLPDVLGKGVRRRHSLRDPCRYCKTAQFVELTPRGTVHIMRFAAGVLRLILPSKEGSEDDRRWWESFRHNHRTQFGDWWARQEPPTEPAITPFPPNTIWYIRRDAFRAAT
jgi:RING finger family protein